MNDSITTKMFSASLGLLLAVLLISLGIFGPEITLIPDPNEECISSITGAFLAMVIMGVFAFAGWKSAYF